MSLPGDAKTPPLQGFTGCALTVCSDRSRACRKRVANRSLGKDPRQTSSQSSMGTGLDGLDRLLPGEVSGPSRNSEVRADTVGSLGRRQRSPSAAPLGGDEPLSWRRNRGRERGLHWRHKERTPATPVEHGGIRTTAGRCQMM